jgi:hypothetical protein
MYQQYGIDPELKTMIALAQVPPVAAEVRMTVLPMVLMKT